MKPNVKKIKKNNVKPAVYDVLANMDRINHVGSYLLEKKTEPKKADVKKADVKKVEIKKVEIKKPKVKKVDIKKPVKAVCPLEDTVDNVEKSFEMKTWYEFRGTGLLLFVNMFLHMFGWAIVVNVGDDDLVRAVYPARTKYRGFSEDSIAKAYKNLSAYVAKVGATLKKEADA